MSIVEAEPVPSISSYFTSPVPSDLLCPICSDVLQSPVVTPCQHLFCENDLLQWFVASNEKGEKPSQRCPQCNTVCDPDSIKKAGRIITNILGDLERRCAESGCDWRGSCDEYKRHLKICSESKRPSHDLESKTNNTAPKSKQKLRALYLRRKLEEATAEQREASRHGSSQVNHLHRQLAELVQHNKGLSKRNRELTQKLEQYKERCTILERALLGQDAVDSFDRAREESLAAARRYMQ
jgi:hypothetical protein